MRPLRRAAPSALSTPVERDLDLENEIVVLTGYQDAQRVVNGTLYFPALAIPLGGKESFSCPDQHVELLRDELKYCHEFLFMGFSAADAHVLKLFEHVNVNKLRIVNGSRDAGHSTLMRLADVNRNFLGQHGEMLFDGGFTKFVQSGEIKKFLA